MVKICTTCKNILPTSVISCPKCENRDLLVGCTKCNKILPSGKKTCPICGEMDLAIVESPKDSLAERTFFVSTFPSTMIKIIVLILLVLGAVFAYKNILWEEDRIAYNLVVTHANSFKAPSSIRVISGVAGKGDKTDDFDEYAFLKISAMNGFGGATIGYYSICEDNLGDLEDDKEFWNDIGVDLDKNYDSLMELCRTEGRLNVKKINKALQRKFG